MFLYTIYEILQMNIKVNFKGNRAKRHACASSNICRMAYAITEWSLENRRHVQHMMSHNTTLQ